MFYAFRHFLNKCYNLKSALGTAMTVGMIPAGTLGVSWLTQHYVENYVAPLQEREIIEKHFMDADACHAALNQHRYQSSRKQ